MSSVNNGKILYPLIDINAVYDTDVGTIQLVSKVRGKVFKKESFIPLEDLKDKLKNREDINPLSILELVGPSHISLDHFYIGLVKRFRKEILYNSPMTSLGRVYTMVHDIGLALQPTIFYHTNEELEFLQEKQKKKLLSKSVSFLSIENIVSTQLQKYEPIVVKDSNIFFQYFINKIEYKKLYIVDTRYNRIWIEETDIGRDISNAFDISFISQWKEDNTNGS